MAPATLIWALGIFLGAVPAEGAGGSLDFVVAGKPNRTLDSQQIEKCGATTVTVFDPLYRKQKKFRAVPLDRVLKLGFPDVDLAGQQLMLRAQDGYGVFVSGARLLEKGAYLAFKDVEVPGWEPIGPQHVHPGPFYVVWSEAHQQDLERYPRPWLLVAVEVSNVEARFPHVRPVGVPDSAPAMLGYRVFRSQCISCHAINREGGRIGPDLNVPQSIVEYRPEPQIRAYIVDPQQFRYGTMPAHPGLSRTDLDGLIAYFRVMKTQKHDPDATAP